MLQLIVPIGLGVAALGGIAWAFLHKKSPAATAAALDDLASKVAAPMPRGERAFTPELAGGVLGQLAGKFYSWPDWNERRVVQVDVNAGGAPISQDLSALGWAKAVNRTQSILAMLSAATTSPGTTQLLRAVPPGAEKDYAGPGGMYAVLLYAGALDKGVAPPGVPPQLVALDAPMPVTPLEGALTELANYPDLMAAFVRLFEQGKDPNALDGYVRELLKDGMVDAPAIMHLRANDLRAGAGQAAAPMPAPYATGLKTQPTFKPGVMDDQPVTPAPQPTPSPTPAAPPSPTGVFKITMQVVSSPSGLNVRLSPSKNATSKGTIPNNAKITAVAPPQIGDASQTEGWYLVQWGSMTGYSSGNYLQDLSGAPPQTPVTPPPGSPLANVTPPIPATSSAMTLKQIQHALNLLGANPQLAEDGAGGPKTTAAVRAFQGDSGLSQDGVAGPATQAALRSALQSHGLV